MVITVCFVFVIDDMELFSRIQCLQRFVLNCHDHSEQKCCQVLQYCYGTTEGLYFHWNKNDPLYF